MKDKILDKIKEIHDTILVPSVDEKPKECLNGMRQLNLITELRGLVEGLNIPDVVSTSVCDDTDEPVERCKCCKSFHEPDVCCFD